MDSFVLFSDTQLVPPGQLNFDLDPAARLRACVAAINEECPQSACCVVTGDLTHWGEVAAYRVLKEELAQLAMPCYLLMGNHDCRQAFLSVFAEHSVEASGFIQYAAELGDTRLLFLDTLEPGRRGGYLCPQRLAWLKSQLERGGRVLLFMHHPPFAVGLPCMDGDGLSNSDELLACLWPHRDIIQHLFFGHLHRTVSGTWHGMGFSCPLSLVHQTPFDFTETRPDYVSMESPQYCKVLLYPDRLVVHHRAFLEGQGRDVPNVRRKRYPKPPL